jgi:DNA processing protein
MPSTPETSPAAHWLSLLLTPGLGPRTIKDLADHFGGAGPVFGASLTELEGAQIPAESAQWIHDGRSLEAGEAEMARCRQAGATVICFEDRSYPELLREIYDPPPVLYLRGDPAALDRFALAIVGTRTPTVYGRLMAERLGGTLPAWGLGIISGLARGIDAQAHKAAVGHGGICIAVLGTGIDTIYPRENTRLAEEILASGGALVSEFPLGTYPAAHNFPVRNRIISGLALGVVVVEGGEYSGSRITARLALEQNREVFAVPGPATQKQAWLPNTLIKQGAKLVTDAMDVIEELPSSVRLRLVTPSAAPPATDSKVAADSPDQAALLAALQVEEALHVDEITERLDNRLAQPEVLSLLLELELAGRIKQLPGKNYIKVL